MTSSSSRSSGVVRVKAEGYTIHVRAVAGVESCCFIDTIDAAFDMGCCPPLAVSKAHVFITHGHVDHIGAFVSHAARRALQRMKPATYYAPAHLVEHMKHALESFSTMQGDEIRAQIVPFAPLQEVHISSQWMVKALATVHRVPSLAYILYRKMTKLKSKYVGLASKEIAALRRSGQEVATTTLSPEIAYTGDTTAEVFESDMLAPEPRDSDLDGIESLGHTNDLLSVKVLITEATYMCDSKTPADAIARGHIHLDQLVALAHRFERVGTIVLVHFSAKYHAAEIEEALVRKVPEPFRSKLRLGCSPSSSSLLSATAPTSVLSTTESHAAPAMNEVE